MRQKWLQKPPLGTPINWAHPSSKGLVLDLEFQEGGGDFANDLSGNANHGVLKNMAFPPTAASGWNPGKFGACPKFDGTDDYVDCGNDASLDITDAITIEAWVKSSANMAYNMLVTKTTWATHGYVLLIEDNAARFGIFDGSTHHFSKSTGTYMDGKWHQIIGRWDKGTQAVDIFVDGAEVTYSFHATSADLGITTNDLIIGSRYTDARFNGQIDQVRIYNRALSAEEVLDSYVNPFGRFERTKWGLLVPTAPPIGAIINQFQNVNVGADLYDGVLAI